MKALKISPSATRRLTDIYEYSAATWGEAQADRYLKALIRAIDDIAGDRVRLRPIPPDMGVAGYIHKCGQHFIYWTEIADDVIGIVTVLHERMHQIEQFAADWPPAGGETHFP